MGKNSMLFKWFLKFGIFKTKGEYEIHDYIREKFCPEYIPIEEFDDKEQILRDTPGPAGVKYAYYVGSKVNGIPGAAIAIAATIFPIILAAVIFTLIYSYVNKTLASDYATKVYNGMCAAALGLVASHMYKIVYFNKMNRKSILIVLPAALVFLFLPSMLGMETSVITPYFVIAIVVVGTIMGYVHNILVEAAKKRENDPNKKPLDPYSKKAKKLRERQLREDEEALRKDRNVREELKKEREKGYKSEKKSERSRFDE